MGSRIQGPSRAFLTRDAHRLALTAHFFALVIGLAGVFVANRFLSPERMWAQWVALAWGLLFLVHLGIFARGTLATMGGARKH
jgi:hypothetical protein